MTPSPTTTKSQKSKSAEERLSVYPVLTFYYGLPPSEIKTMPAVVKRAYLAALPAFLAEQQHKAIQAVSFPNYKKADQQRIMREIKRAQESNRKAPAPSVPQLERSTKGVGIGIRKVKRKKKGA